MSEKEGFQGEPSTKEADHQRRDSAAVGGDDAGAIPKGTIDPIYEAKARVLNRAVSLLRPCIVTDGSLLPQIQDIGMG